MPGRRAGHALRPLAVAWGALVLALAGAPAAARAQQEIPRLDSLFRAYVSGTGPGCVVGASSDGRLLLERAYGMADLEHEIRNDSTTIFEAGSVSKQITAAAVMLLVQQGKVRLDDPARRWLPEVPLFHGRQMTVADLLHHTSGLREWGAIVALRGWRQGRAAYTNAHVLDVVTRQRALNFEPASEFLYSNTNYSLLAVLVERASGQSLAAFSRDQLFRPLGMSHTSWRDDFTRVVKWRAIAYERRGTEAGESKPLAPDSTGAEHAAMPGEDAYGDNGLLTTVGDLLRWNEELRTGAVLGPELARALERPGVLASGRAIGYGAGLFTSPYRGQREIWHTGAIGGYRAYLARYPQLKLSVAVLCNDGQVNPLVVGHRVSDIFLGRAAAKSAPQPRAITASNRMRRGLGPVTGLYWDTRTGEAVTLVPEGGGSVGARGSAVLVISATEFRLASDPRVRILARFVKGRARPQLLWISPDADTTLLEPVEPFVEKTANLNDYVGDWYSPEAEVSYSFAVLEGKLVLMFRPDMRVELKPIYADGFVARGLIFRFERDGDGKVAGLGIWVPRARNIRFLHIIP